jgi:His-Xaa-Ser system protein HxsD
VKLKARLGGNQAVFTVDKNVYRREAIYGTALVFTNRCHVYLASRGRGAVIVTLEGKEPLDDARLRELAGEFHNELLNQTLRWMVGRQNKKTKEAIILQALFAAQGDPRLAGPARTAAKRP